MSNQYVASLKIPAWWINSLWTVTRNSSYRHGHPLTIESDKDGMSTAQEQLGKTLSSLQATASLCARVFTSRQLKVEFQVAFSNGAPLPWRLLEIHRSAKVAGGPRLLRRMHCFCGPESLELSIHERITWKARDRALVSSHLVRVRESRIQDTASPDGAARDLLALNATRQALRAQMCLTKPGRVVDLPKGRSSFGAL
jgi:hypothetical protein